MRIPRTVTAVSIVGVLVVWPAYAHAALRAHAQQSPPGVYRGGQSGVKNPRVLREVKPLYTPEAMRAKIEGSVVVQCVVQPDGTVSDVRVIKSVDSVYGLDEEAVKAAKQWRFVPGTKDGVAVPVIVSIELNFTLRDRPRPPAPLAWPDSFSGAENRVDAAGWVEESAEASGVGIRVAYPKGWTIRQSAPGIWFGVESEGAGTRVVIVGQPTPASLLLSGLLPAGELSQVADSIRREVTAKGSTARVSAVGQVQVSDRVWIWHDIWVPPDDPAVPAQVASPFQGKVDGTRLVTFFTTAGTQRIGVTFLTIRLHDTPETAAQDQLRQAGAQFRTILERMTIEVR